MESPALRVLLVEDNPAEARLLEIGLREGADPIAVRHVEQLSDALHLLATERFDALLLDLSLPHSQGLAVLDRLQAARIDVPVLVLTGVDDQLLANEAIRRGAQDYLVKGQTDGRLLPHAVQHAIQRSRAERALREADRRKDEFLAKISHELRTPMNAILGMTELALGEELAPVVREYLETAKDSARVLLALLNEILDFSRIQAGQMTLESVPFSLGTTLDEIMRVLAIRAFEKGIELICDLPAGVPDELVGDPLRLRQIITNLVGNAIKFTQRGEVLVRVGVTAQSEREMGLEFAVSDTGIGISPENLSRIFAPFAQADVSTTRHYGGTGLGLTIATSLATLMGGRLWVESQLGLGSTFRFTVRLGLPNAPAAASCRPDLPIEALAGVPVLVVDDNAAGRQIVADMLAGWGMVADQAADGQSALVKLHEAVVAGRGFPLVLLDAVMPDIDGFTLYEWIQRDERLTGAAILMISSADRQVQARANRQTSQVLYLEKPIARQPLCRAVLKALDVDIHRSDRQSAESVPPAPRAARSLRVLLAEDTPANQKLIVHILRRRGHEVEVARDGREATELVRRCAFDVVLMDVQMPVMDGFQATAFIRALDETARSRLPIVALTAHAMKGDAERCLAAGMDAYLAKPIDAKELVRLVESFGTGARS